MITRYKIHLVIYSMSVISYYYLNNINNTQMCHFLIKFICCNKNLKDSHKTFEHTNVIQAINGFWKFEKKNSPGVVFQKHLKLNFISILKLGIFLKCFISYCHS